MEMMRDHADNSIVVCSIENVDPMGVHTGDSITVAPAQTLTDREYHSMRDAAIAVLRAIGVDTGGSNIQFAVNPETGRMVVIEMNPRVSRSSALASKATGYPIAKVAALLAVGYRLDEIPNDITGRTTAAFEPTLDYVVVKIPRFQLEKFPGTDSRLTTQMKSVGEVMAIGRTFKEALGKALRSLELDATPKLDFEHLREYLAYPTPERLAYIFAALRRGLSVEEIHTLTHIDRWFLSELASFISFEGRLHHMSSPWEEIEGDKIRTAKAYGFSDRELGEIFDRCEEEIRRRREQLNVRPVFKMVDTCAAEFEAVTPYFYSTYNGTENEALHRPPGPASERLKVMILGSGPNRIGQGIEFDYANVHAVWALQEEGYDVIMVNSNPETVSTDYDISNRLYFEPLTLEDVLAVVADEEPIGVVVGFGGQTPLKLAHALVQEGLPLLGSGFEAIEQAENREQFGALLNQLGLKSPPSGTATSVEEAIRVADSLGYPVLARPSYILGGRAMEIADTPTELRRYVAEATRVSAGHPVLIDRFLEHALEIDVDVLSDGRDVWVAGLMEQIEEAGVHSGDSACVLPPVSLSPDIVSRIEQAAARLVVALEAKGLVNIQMAVKGNELFILEANPRASRTVPFVSKAIGIPVAKLAAQLSAPGGDPPGGRSLRDLLAPYWPFSTRPGWPFQCKCETSPPLNPPRKQGGGQSPTGKQSPIPDYTVQCPSLAQAVLRVSGDPRLPTAYLLPTPWPGESCVKEAVLPFGRFPGSDILLGPEMRSTGEVMSFGQSFPEAFAKSQIAAGNPLPTEGTILVSLADPHKREGAALVSHLYDLGFEVVATRGTARVLQAMRIPAEVVSKVGEGRPDVVDRIAQGGVDLVINTPSSSPSTSPSTMRQQPTIPLPSGAEERGVRLALPGQRTVGYRIRTAALEHHVPYVTTLAALRATVAAIRSLRSGRLPVRSLQHILA